MRKRNAHLKSSHPACRIVMKSGGGAGGGGGGGFSPQEKEQIEGMKKVLNGAKGVEARKSAEKRRDYLKREISAMKKLNESYNKDRLGKFESQLKVISEALK